MRYFLLKRGGGAPKHISSEGGVQLFIIVEKNLTFEFVVLPVCWFAVSSPSEIRH